MLFLHHLLFRVALLALGVVALLLPACTSFDPEAKQLRDAQIRQEPRGDYFVGRRYYTWRTRYWGYLRRPGELWETAKLTVMNERIIKQPDRLPEAPISGPAHGFDHNFEYRIWGRYTGRLVYDPNSDLEVAEFQPTRFELINKSPGFLFDPRESYDPKRLPGREWSGRGY